MKIKHTAALLLLVGSIIGSASVQANAVNPGNPIGNNTTNNQGTFTATLRAKTATYIQTNSLGDVETNSVPPVMGTMQFVANTAGDGTGTTRIVSAGRLTGTVDGGVLNTSDTTGASNGTISATYDADLLPATVTSITNSTSLPGTYVLQLAGAFYATNVATTRRGVQTFGTTEGAADQNVLNVLTFTPTATIPGSGKAQTAYIDTTNSVVTGRRLLQ